MAEPEAGIKALTLGTQKPRVMKKRKQKVMPYKNAGKCKSSSRWSLLHSELQRDAQFAGQTCLLSTKDFLLRGCNEKLTLFHPWREEKREDLPAHASQLSFPVNDSQGDVFPELPRCIIRGFSNHSKSQISCLKYGISLNPKWEDDLV